jgi:hypothetical protein
MESLTYETAMTDEQTTDQTADPAASNVETKVLSTDEAGKLAAFRDRKLFADAQEHFTAGEFVEANRSLREIPEDARGPDVQRLAKLVAERIREVAELRSAVQTALNQRMHDDLQPKLLRLLELQPGDEWANAIRHRIEEEEHAREAGVPDAGSVRDAHPASVFAKATVVLDEPIPPATRRRAAAECRPPPVAPAAPIELADDDLDDVWEFGERLVQPSPPPLKRSADWRSRKPLPAGTHEDDDFAGWLEAERAPSSPAMWIAIAVGGVVILLALIATIVVLLVERGT